MGFFEKRAKDIRKTKAASFKSDTKAESKAKVTSFTSKPSTSSSTSSSSSSSSKRRRSSRSRSSSGSSKGFDIRTVSQPTAISKAPVIPKAVPRVISSGGTTKSTFESMKIGGRKPTTTTQPFDIRTVGQSKVATPTPITTGGFFDTISKTTRGIKQARTPATFKGETEKQSLVKGGEFGISGTARDRVLPSVDFFKKTRVTTRAGIDLTRPLLDTTKPLIAPAKTQSDFQKQLFGEPTTLVKFDVNPFASKKEQLKQAKQLISTATPGSDLELLQGLSDKEIQQYMSGDLRLSRGAKSTIGGGTRVDLETGRLTEFQPSTIESIDKVLFRQKSTVEGNKQQNLKTQQQFTKNENLIKQIDIANTEYNKITNNGKKTANLNIRQEKANTKQDSLNTRWEQLNNEADANTEGFKSQATLNTFNEKKRKLSKEQTDLDSEKNLLTRDIDTYNNQLTTMDAKSEKLYADYQTNLKTIETNPIVSKLADGFTYTPLATQAVTTKPHIQFKTGGSKKVLSDNIFIQNLDRGFRGKDIYGVEKLSVLGGTAARLGQISGASVDVFDFGLLGKGGGGRRAFETTLSKGLGIKDEARVKSIAGFAGGTGSVIGLVGTGGLVGAGLKVGGKALSRSSVKLLAKIGGGTAATGRFVVGGSRALGDIGLTAKGVGLGVSETTRVAKTDAVKRQQINQLKNKYGFSTVKGRNTWIDGVSSSGFIAQQLPGVVGGISAVTTTGGASKAGADAVEGYLDSLKITNPTDRRQARELITDEVVISQSGETAGVIGGVSAGTEKLGQLGVSKLFARVGRVGTTKAAKQKIASQITKSSMGQIGQLGVAEGLAVETTIAGARGRDVKPIDLALSGVGGGLSAGLLGGAVVGRSTRQALKLSPTKLDRLVSPLELSANVLDIAEKPGDITHSIRNLITGRTPAPGVRGIGGKQFELVSLTGKQQRQLGLYAKLNSIVKGKKRVFTTTPTFTGTQQKFAIPSPAQTQVGILSKLGVPSQVQARTIVSQPVATLTATPTRTTTKQFIASLTATPTAVTTPTEVLTPSITTRTPISVFTPQSGAAVFPGFGNARGFGFGRGKGQIGVKVNPIQSLRNKGFLKKKL